MARTNIAGTVPLGGIPVLPLVALSAQLLFTAVDTVNGNSTPSTGRELLIVRSTDAAPQTITVFSVKDSLNRTGDITAYSLPIGSTTNTFAVLGPFPVNGWKQADGTLWYTGSAATIFVAVLVLPPTV